MHVCGYVEHLLVLTEMQGDASPYYLMIFVNGNLEIHVCMFACTCIYIHACMLTFMFCNDPIVL